MVGRAKLTHAQEPQKSPNARGPKAKGLWVTSQGVSERAWVRQPESQITIDHDGPRNVYWE